jgi:hypothetical protein
MISYLNDKFDEENLSYCKDYCLVTLQFVGEFSLLKNAALSKIFKPLVYQS